MWLPKRTEGFTLLEVLVALAVVAIALGAAVRLSGDIIDGTQGLKERTVARWIAQNHINSQMVLAGNWPAIGARDGTESMAGMDFVWQEDVSNTPDKNYRRIEVRVYNPDDRNFALATLIGYIHPRHK